MLHDASDEPAPCPYMVMLIDLLGDMPAQRDQRSTIVVGKRLDQLDEEARRHEAPETTLAAIRGARVLLTLAEMPPPKIPSQGAPR